MRLKKRWEFLRAQKLGRALKGANMMLLGLHSEQKTSRLGIVATKRLGNAVARNRFKRVTREVFRQNYAAVPQNLDVVVIARRRAALALNYKQARSEMLSLLKKW